LSFFSSGHGIFDHLAITLAADIALRLRVASSLQARTLAEVAADRSWAEDLRWLLTTAETGIPLRPAVVWFINQHRREFQGEYVSSSRILFGYESNINDRVAL